MNPIWSANGRISMNTKVQPDGRIELYDNHMRYLGHYNPTTNQTYDAHMRRIGSGNILMTLVR